MKNLIQDEKSHKFSSDALLLANFCPLEKINLFAELGTGCGIIALEILKKKENLNAIAIDFNKELLDTARENAEIYNYQSRINFYEEDLNSCPDFINKELKEYNNICDLIVTNPPWLLENQGKLPQEEMKKKALFGDRNTYDIFFNNARYFLKERGLLATISIPRRLEDIFLALNNNNFCAKKMQFVFKDKISDAIFVMLLAEYRGKLASKAMPDLQIVAPYFL